VPRRLAPKLIISLTIIVIIVQGVAGIIAARTVERELLYSIMLGADQLSRGITSSTWKAMLADRRDDVYDVIQTIAMKQGINRIRMFNRDGRLMYSTRPEENTRIEKRAEVCSPCHAGNEPKVKLDIPFRSRTFKDVDGRRKLAMVTPIYNEPSCSQAACHAHPAGLKVLGVLDLTLDLDTVDQDVAAVRVRVLATTVIQILLISVLTGLFARHFVSAPIRKLIEGTRAVSAMQLKAPIDVRTKDELGELALSFNVMRERLAEAMAENEQFMQLLESRVQERTEQLKVTQQKLIQSDRLASLGQLAASMAHEINNPVSGVLNLSMLMQRILTDDGIPQGRVEEFRKYLAQVASETNRVGRIVSDLLAFSRRTRPQSTAADLNAIVRATLSLVSYKLVLNNVEIVRKFSEDLPKVQCDPSQIQQVVTNLVLNGAESCAVKGGGVLTLTTRRHESGNAVLLEIQDDGEGIPDEHLSKIFDPFFTTKAEGKGVGLGLAVVYGIVEAHGGEISVDSDVSKGTRFTVTLPLSAGEDPDAGAPSERPGPGRNA
jgi:two-component system, NtrC family, sensor kinase